MLVEVSSGVTLYKNYLSKPEQLRLIEAIREAAAAAPLFVPRMPRTGKALSVRMTNMGALGWVTDKEGGYRYQPHHPETGNAWPRIPEQLLDVWRETTGVDYEPEACLVNHYAPDAKMGLHQDKDEQWLEAPVVSISLGDTCLFRIGTTERRGKTKSVRLESGDVVVLSGPGRLVFHGVDRIMPNTSDVLKQAGRINLTLRRVTQV